MCCQQTCQMEHRSALNSQSWQDIPIVSFLALSRRSKEACSDIQIIHISRIPTHAVSTLCTNASSISCLAQRLQCAASVFRCTFIQARLRGLPAQSACTLRPAARITAHHTPAPLIMLMICSNLTPTRAPQACLKEWDKLKRGQPALCNLCCLLLHCLAHAHLCYQPWR
jgi:hypothetical protein